MPPAPAADSDPEKQFEPQTKDGGTEFWWIGSKMLPATCPAIIIWRDWPATPKPKESKAGSPYGSAKAFALTLRDFHQFSWLSCRSWGTTLDSWKFEAFCIPMLPIPSQLCPPMISNDFAMTSSVSKSSSDGDSPWSFLKSKVHPNQLCKRNIGSLSLPLWSSLSRRRFSSLRRWEDGDEGLPKHSHDVSAKKLSSRRSFSCACGWAVAKSPLHVSVAWASVWGK